MLSIEEERARWHELRREDAERAQREVEHRTDIRKEFESVQAHRTATEQIYERILQATERQAVAMEEIAKSLALIAQPK